MYWRKIQCALIARSRVPHRQSHSKITCRRSKVSRNKCRKLDPHSSQRQRNCRTLSRKWTTKNLRITFYTCGTAFASVRRWPPASMSAVTATAARRSAQLYLSSQAKKSWIQNPASSQNPRMLLQYGRSAPGPKVRTTICY